MEPLVYDRTERNKGTASVSILNRIEQWTSYLAAQLRAYGYSVTVETRSWTREDYPTRTEIDRIRRNVEALQTGFYSLPDWREIVYNNTLDFGQCNALEWDLQAIYTWLQRTVASFWYSGEIFGGET